MSETGPNNTKLVYEYAQQFILDMINGPDFCAGDRIPSERELAESFNISRMTIRKAIDRLVSKGLLIRKGTRGTFMPSPVIMRPIDAQMYPYSISDMVIKSGGIPGSKLLFFEKQKVKPNNKKQQCKPKGFIDWIYKLKAKEQNNRKTNYKKYFGKSKIVFVKPQNISSISLRHNFFPLFYDSPKAKMPKFLELLF